MPVTLIGEAMFARALSALKDERKRASELLVGPTPSFSGEKKKFIDDVERALYASKIVSYAQGYMLLRDASREFKWDLNFGSIALMWRGGCIIRSRFLGDIKKAFDKNPKLRISWSTTSSAPPSRSHKTAGAARSRTPRPPASPRPP